MEKAGRWRHLPRSAKACATVVKRHCPFRKPAKDTAVSILAERPESRARTAERGAGRCHLFILSRGSFRRPVRMLFETTGETAAWISLLAARPAPAYAKFFPFPRNMR